MQPPSLSSRPPNTHEVLERIEAKLDRLERTLGPLAILGELPAVAGTALETLDDRVRGREPDVDARLRGAVSLLERVSRPETLRLLHGAVDLVEALPGLVSTAVDTIDDAADPESLDLHGRVEAGMKLLGQLTQPKTLALMGQAVGFLRRAETLGERRSSAWGLFKALREPHAQRALGFAVDMLERFGQALDGQAPRESTKSLSASSQPRNR